MWRGRNKKEGYVCFESTRAYFFECWEWREDVLFFFLLCRGEWEEGRKKERVKKKKEEKKVKEKEEGKKGQLVLHGLKRKKM